MTRFLRYSCKNTGPLASNPWHLLARNHALSIYGAEAIYSFIPKNACSTLRTSVAYANGCIERAEEFNWIHLNNTTFSASLSELARAKYTFTVLRCPYSRLASAFLDKIVSKSVVAWKLHDLKDRSFDLDTITFSDFVQYLHVGPVRNGEIHWRSQIDFLVYKDYDDYFSFSSFAEAARTLEKKIGLEVIDARTLTNHGLDTLSLVDDDCFAETPARDLAAMKNEGISPSHRAMYNDKLVEQVDKLYTNDFALYRDIFGDHGLLFYTEKQKTSTG